jgi:predicted RNA-binding protein
VDLENMNESFDGKINFETLMTTLRFKHKVSKYAKEMMAKLKRNNDASKLTMLNFKLITYELIY